MGEPFVAMLQCSKLLLWKPLCQVVYSDNPCMPVSVVKDWVWVRASESALASER